MAHSFDECYRRNLDALRARQPDLAERMDEAAIPVDIVSVIGRDGGPTLRIPSPNGGSSWFGQSSMPRVSAEEMFCSVRADGGSVTLPGILTGAEVLVITRRLAPPFAVFVIEESPLNLKLAMRLHDYSALFREGRLVFILGDNFRTHLRSFFLDHPGYELPRNLFRVAQKTAGQIAELQREIEQAGAEVMHVQGEKISALTKRIRERSVRLVSDTPRVAVLGVGLRAASVEPVHRIARALGRLGWPHEVCVLNRPDRCHIVARLSMLERAAPEFVFYVNGCPPAERALLPPDLPVVNLYLPGFTPSASLTTSLGRFDLLLAQSRSQAEQLIANGLPPDRVLCFEPAADVDPDESKTAPAPFPARQSGGAADADHGRVLVTGSLPDDRPEVCGITLPSQVGLWRAMQEQVLLGADRFEDAAADAFLKRAEEVSGTVLNDSALRQSFLELLRTRVAPAIIGRSLVHSMVKKGVRFSLWGDHWPAMGRGEDARRGAVPNGMELQQLVREGDLVVIPRWTHEAVQTAVDAMAGGAVVVMHGSIELFEREYPGLAGATRGIRFFRTSDELLIVIQSLQTSGEDVQRSLREARGTVTREHSMVSRLEQLVGEIRRRQSEGAICPPNQMEPGRMDARTLSESTPCG